MRFTSAVLFFILFFLISPRLSAQEQIRKGSVKVTAVKIWFETDETKLIAKKAQICKTEGQIAISLSQQNVHSQLNLVKCVGVDRHGNRVELRILPSIFLTYENDKIELKTFAVEVTDELVDGRYTSFAFQNAASTKEESLENLALAASNVPNDPRSHQRLLNETFYEVFVEFSDPLAKLIR